MRSMIVRQGRRPTAWDPRLQKSACAGDIDSAALELAFSKKKIEERKQWLQGYVPGTYLDMSREHISYNDFVNKVLIR